MKNLKIVASAVIAAVLLASSAVYAYDPAAECTQKKAFAEKKEAKKEALYKNLNLTEEQKKALEANKTQTREQVKVLYQQVKDKTAMLRQELQGDTLNMDKINQINGELKNLQAQILDQKLQGILGVRKILTPEQFKKFMAEIQLRAKNGKNKWHEMKKGM